MKRYVPSSKSPEIDKVITNLFGIDRKKIITEGKCAFGCNPPNLNFRDALSKREYEISGMCQNCQDKTFVND